MSARDYIIFGVAGALAGALATYGGDVVGEHAGYERGISAALNSIEMESTGTLGPCGSSSPMALSSPSSTIVIPSSQAQRVQVCSATEHTPLEARIRTAARVCTDARWAHRVDARDFDLSRCIAHDAVTGENLP
jgi:hypothetical protein